MIHMNAIMSHRGLLLASKKNLQVLVCGAGINVSAVVNVYDEAFNVIFTLAQSNVYSVYSVVFSNDAKYMAVSYYVPANASTPGFRVYRTSDWSIIITGPNVGSTDIYTHELCFSPDGTRLFITASGYYFKVYDTNSGVVIATPELEGNGILPNQIYCTASFHGGNRIVVGGFNYYNSSRSICVIDMVTLSVVASLSHNGASSKTIVCTPNDEYIISGGDDGTLRFYETYASYAQTGAYTPPTTGYGPNGLAISPDSTKIALARYNSSTGLHAQETYLIGANPWNLLLQNTVTINALSYGQSWSVKGTLLGSSLDGKVRRASDFVMEGSVPTSGWKSLQFVPDPLYFSPPPFKVASAIVAQAPVYVIERPANALTLSQAPIYVIQGV